MKILALDPATKCGYAHNISGRVKSGVWNFKTGHFDGAGMYLIKFKAEIKPLIKEVDMVAFEGVMAHLATSTYAQHKYGGFLAMIQSTCEELNTPYCGLGVGEIKKFWTGKGNASKEDMVHSARVNGFNPIDDNEADALAIWHMAHHIYGDLI